MAYALEHGIRLELFGTMAPSTVWAWMHSVYTNRRRFGAVPSRQKALEQFKNLELPKPIEELETLVDYVKSSHIHRKTTLLVADWEAEAKANPIQALTELKSKLDTLTETEIKSDDVVWRERAFTDLLENLGAKDENDGLTGLPFPWDVMNENTGGLQPGDLVLLWALPKSKKCVKSGLVTTRTGERVDIGLLPRDVVVSSHTAATGKVRWAPGTKIESGVKQCVRVTTASGRVLETSDDHYYMVPEGSFQGCFEPIKNLAPGSYVATARTIPTWEPVNSLTAKTAWLIGVLTGDGGLTQGSPTLSTADAEIVRAVRRIAASFGCKIRPRKGSDYDYGISWTNRQPVPNPIVALLTELGLQGKKSEFKHVPTRVYTSTRTAICAYLAGLLDTDGGCYTGASHHKACFASSSFALAEGIQHLLTRIGVTSTLQTTTTNFDTTSYVVNVYSQENHALLYKHLGPHLVLTRKKTVLHDLATRPITRKRNKDSVPHSARLERLIYAEKGDKRWPLWGSGNARLSPPFLFRRSGCISRHILTLLADEWDSDALRREATNDIVWEKIVSIEPIGPHPCYDICITDNQDPNFVVGDYIVHNTWIGLVMANYLMECGYRVLVYSKEMVWDKIRDRIACIKAMIGYAGFTKNTLRADERFRLLAAIEQTVSDSYPGELIFTSCDKPDGTAGGPAELRAKIQTYKPHFVFLDSSYMLELPGVKDAYDWRAIAGVTRALKQISKSTGIPMLAIMQENERLALKYGNKGRGTASISMFSNMIQDADVGIRVVNHATRDETSLVMAACRETNWPGCTIHTKLCQNFDYAHDHLYGIEEVSGDEDEAMPDPPEDLPEIRPGASFADQYLNPDADFDPNPTEPEPEA